MSDDKEVPKTALPVVEVVTQEEMNEWYELTQKMAEMKTRELVLRNKIFNSYFPDPVEGTNNIPLEDGFVLKAQYKLNRTVDEAVLSEKAQEFKDAKIPVKDLVVLKPELSTRVYRELTEEQRALFDKALVIRPGTPQLEITKAKRALRK
jgi:hypothetical protein